MAFADATVEVTADWAKFRKSFRTDLETNILTAAASAGPAIRRAGNQTGDDFWNSLANSSDGSAAKFARAGEDAAANVRHGFRTGDNLDIDAGQLRKNAPKFALEGERLGRDFTDGFKVATRDLKVNINVGRIAALTTLVPTFVALASSAVQLTAALAPAVGALALLPGAVLGAGAALTTLVIGFKGVGGAIGAGLSGDTEKYAQALQKLAPAARDTVAAVVALKPGFDALRTSVQGQLFEGLSTQIQQLGQVWLPMLQTQLTGFAAVFNTTFRQVATASLNPATVTNFATALEGARQGLAGMLAPSGQLVTAFASLSAVSAPFLARIGNAFGGQLAGIAQWIEAASATGKMTQILDNALTVFNQLGAILGNVSTALFGIFNAAQTTGAGFLNSLVSITAALSAFVNSTQGQTALGQFFATTAQLLNALLPLIGQLAGALSAALLPVFSAISQAIAALAPSLQVVIGALSTALASIGPALGTILTALANALAPLLTALAPILPLIGELVAALAGPLAAVLGNISALFTPIITALVSGLGPAVQAIGQILTQIGTTLATQAPTFAAIGTAFGTLLQAALSLIPALMPLVQVFLDLWTAVVEKLGPVIQQLAPQLATALVPAFTALGDAMKELGPALQPVITALSDHMVTALDAILPVLPQLVGLFADLVTAVAPLLPVLVQVLEPALKFAAIVIKLVSIGVLIPMITAFSEALKLVAPVISGVVDVFGVLVKIFADVADAISNLSFSDVIDAFSQLGTTILDFLGTVGQTLLDFFTNLPANIGDALVNLPSMLYNAFFTALGFAANAVADGIVLILTGLIALPQMAVDTISGLGSLLFGALSGAFTFAASAVTGGISFIIGFIVGLPGQISSVLSGLPSLLFNIFSTAFNGVTSAIQSGVSGAISFVKGLPQMLIDALGDIGNKLFNAVRGPINRVVEAANNIIDKLNDVPGVDLPHIPKMARGGLITSPTLALVGEAGPELVLPLNNPKRMNELLGLIGINSATGRTSTRTTVVNAPINVITTGAADPETVAYLTQARVARIVATS